MRYGTSHCGNDRLPAERLEQAVTRRLWQILNDRELIHQAITETYENIAQHDEHQQNELAAIQGKLSETRAAMDHYFRAFETGTMPEDTCAPRIAALSNEAKALEARASELAAQGEEQPERATSSDLDAMRTDPREDRSPNPDRRNPNPRT
jgi:chromosome segregation ATPase